MLETLLHSTLPAIWVAIGPSLVALITKGVNMASTAYVPRWLQGILAAVIGAIFAGVTGEAAGVDPASATVLGGVSGAVGQTLAAIKPATLLTEAPKD